MRNSRLFLKLCRRFSKFESESLSYVDLVRNLSTVKIPENYNKSLFSSLLVPPKPKTQKSAPSQETQLQTAGKKPQNKVLKSADFSLSIAEYDDIIQKNLFGSLEVFEVQGVMVCIIGACYTHIPPENIWKLLSMFEPDMVLLQAFPDDFVPGFRLNHKSESSGAFSPQNYAKQLFVTQPAAYPEQFYSEIISAVNGQLPDAIDEPFTKSFLQEAAEGFNVRKGLPPLRSFDKLTDAAIATASLYAKKHDVPIGYSDIPDIILRERICVRSGLTDLKNILKTATENIAKNPDFTPDTPMNLAHLAYHQTFTLPSDNYTTSFIQQLIARKKPKRLLVLAGNLQAQSLKALLTRKAETPILNHLSSEAFKETLFQKHSLEILTEKLGIIDVIKHGKGIIADKITQFPQSMALIQKHSGLSETDKEYRFYHYLHQQMVKKYLDQYLKVYEKGIEELKLHFQQRLIREEKRASGASQPQPKSS